MRLLEAVAVEAGVTPEQAGIAVTGVLRRLHRLSVVDSRGLSAVVLETRLELGREACWHLVGLFEDQRINHDRDISWTETLERLDPAMRRLGVLIEKWREERGPGSGEDVEDEGQ